MVSTSAPGPMMVMLVAIMGRLPARLIEPVTLKVTGELAVPAITEVSTCRNEPGPESFMFVTVTDAAAGVAMTASRAKDRIYVAATCNTRPQPRLETADSRTRRLS